MGMLPKLGHRSVHRMPVLNIVTSWLSRLFPVFCDLTPEGLSIEHHNHESACHRVHPFVPVNWMETWRYLD